MGLLICPDCNGKVSDQAGGCPHCGRPVARAASPMMAAPAPQAAPVAQAAPAPQAAPEAPKKRRGWLMMLIGIGVFFYATEAKKKYLLKEEVSSKPALTLSVPAKKGVEHYIEVAAEALTSGSIPAVLDANVSVLHNGKVVKSCRFQESVLEGEGERQASNSQTFYVTPESAGPLVVQILRTQGSRSEAHIYAGMPSGLETVPGLAILFTLWGLVRFLRGPR